MGGTTVRSLLHGRQSGGGPREGLFVGGVTVWTERGGTTGWNYVGKKRTVNRNAIKTKENGGLPQEVEPMGGNKSKTLC